MPTDFSAKTDSELENWIHNHEIKGATNSSLYFELLEERAQRKSKVLRIEKSLHHLMDMSRAGRFTTYGDLAKASEVPWEKARHLMNSSGGHLDQLLDICHARGLPVFTSICVNQKGVETGKLEESALEGFAQGVKRLGLVVNDREVLLRKCQDECFQWGRKN